MNEQKTFSHKIIIKFSELNQDLENTIYQKLVNQEFLTDFEVLNILSFNVKEMKVSGIIVICTVDITCECNLPSKGKILEITDFEHHKDTLIYRNSRIQIIVNKPKIIKPKYTIKIEDFKVISKNILCVASIID